MKLGRMALLVCIGLGITGCGSNGVDSTKKVLEDKGYKTLVNFNYYDDYRDEKGNCYYGDGREKPCENITEIDKPGFLITNEKVNILGSVYEKGVILLYRGNDGAYNVGTVDGEEFEEIVLNSEEGSVGYSGCVYVIKGEASKDATLCDSKREKEYLGLKEEFDSILSDLDVKSEDLKAYVTWFSENNVDDYKKHAEDYMKSQKSLTPDEVSEKLVDNYFELKKTDDGFLISGLTESFYISQKEENAGFMYNDNTMDTSEDHMSYYFNLEGKLENGVDKAGSCVYDLKMEKTTKGDCSSSQIDEAELTKSSFDILLKSNHISFDEFITFTTDYIAK